MRPLELLFLLVGIAYLLWLCCGTGLPESPFHWLAFAAAMLGLAHLWFEGYRWHMLPGYAFLLLILLFYPWCSAHDFRIRLSYSALAWAVGVVLVGSTCVLAGILYPVFAFVPLTGPHAVGTFALHLIDSSHGDPYAGDASARRELMVQFWYPAERARGRKRARYRDGRRDSRRTSNLPLVKTRSFLNAPVLREQKEFPVLIFTGPNHRFQNTFQTEELASHGFLVVGLDHPYGSDRVTFPDGRVIRRRKENVFLDFRTDETLADSVREVEGELAVRAADVEFVIAELGRWQSSRAANPLAGRVDLSRIGILGHSFGGAVAAEVCLRNPSVRAGINMDGWMFGDSAREGIPQPFFFMADCTPMPAAHTLSPKNDNQTRAVTRTIQGYQEIENSLNRHGGYYLQTAGLEHMNYSDYPLYSRMKSKTGAGRADIRRAHRMVNRLSVAFFKTYLLQHSEGALIRAAAEFPEANFRKVPAMAMPAGSVFEEVSRRI